MAAWFTYDYSTQRVWLDDVPSVAGGNQWALCAVHAARLRPPRGWEQLDRRGAAPVPAEEPEFGAEFGGEVGLGARPTSPTSRLADQS